MYSQLDSEYLKKYFHEITSQQAKQRGLNLSKYPSVTTVSLNHLTLTEAYDIKLLDDEDMKNKEFIVIWRDPVDRFISICNHLGINPNALISRLKNPSTDSNTKTLLGRNSWYLPTSDIAKLNNKAIKTTNLPFNDRTLIASHFRKFVPDFKDVCLNKRKRSSFNRSKLGEDKLQFIKDFYQEDFAMLDSLQK